MALFLTQIFPQYIGHFFLAKKSPPNNLLPLRISSPTTVISVNMKKKKQSRNHRINGGKKYNAKKFPPSVKGLAEALKVSNKKNIRDIKKNLT